MCPRRFLFEGRAEGNIGKTIGGALRNKNGGVADKIELHTCYEL